MLEHHANRDHLQPDELEVAPGFTIRHHAGCLTFTGGDGRERRIHAATDGEELFEQLRYAILKQRAEAQNRNPQYAVPASPQGMDREWRGRTGILE